MEKMIYYYKLLHEFNFPIVNDDEKWCECDSLLTGNIIYIDIDGKVFRDETKQIQYTIGVSKELFDLNMHVFKNVTNSMIRKKKLIKILHD